jgi:3-phosphoshikimate 1-carboxyvinyltransferase
MGAEVMEFEDGLDVPGGQTLHGATSTPAATTASPWPSAWPRCVPKGDTLIQGAESAAISFPEFFDLLDQVAER